MEITLSLSSDDLDRDDLQDVTRDLCRDLRDEAGVEASLATQAARPDDKAVDLPVWGQIVIAAIGSGGAVVALINVLKANIQRKRLIQIEVKNENGRTVKIKAENSDDEMIRLLKSLLEEEK
ncbi:MAG: effector-associated constant component EACC1 [Blastocatellia bacterium]